MRNIFWVTGLACVVIGGCQQSAKEVAYEPDGVRQPAKVGQAQGRSSSPQQANVVAVTDTTTDITPAPIDPASAPSLASQLTINSTPDDVCRVFLEALRIGDRITAFQLLTRDAQLETSRADLELESPGTPESHIQVLSSRYATANQQMAQVDCLLSEPGAEGPPIQLAWLMRQEANGWKISGMSIETDEEGSVELLSFESADDLQRIQQSIETESTVETSHRPDSTQPVPR
ncbi:MAG: hypothetical protein ACR2NP_13700 [Pirellulaceae bacterium]